MPFFSVCLAKFINHTFFCAIYFLLKTLFCFISHIFIYFYIQSPYLIFYHLKLFFAWLHVCLKLCESHFCVKIINFSCSLCRILRAQVHIRQQVAINNNPAQVERRMRRRCWREFGETLTRGNFLKFITFD
jgi:hypothetical protein